jgi:hypothetical protein
VVKVIQVVAQNQHVILKVAGQPGYHLLDDHLADQTINRHCQPRSGLAFRYDQYRGHLCPARCLLSLSRIGHIYPGFQVR